MLVGVIVVLIYTGIRGRTPPIVQPIAYNHKLHIDNGLNCSDCHQGIGTSSPSAGRPSIRTCSTCHDPSSPLGKSPEEAKLLEFIRNDREPPWKRIYRVPDYVYFSHYRHATLGKIGCDTCHGKVEGLTEPPPRPLVRFSMDWCIACHKKNQVSVDCNRCHK